MYGNLVGKHLTHCSKGHGIIIDHKESLNIDKDYITVKYDNEDIKDSTFVYPDVFDGLLNLMMNQIKNRQLNM